MSFEEKKAIKLLNNASVEAFEQLYLRYSAKLYNFVMKMSKGDGYLAEELVQRTFIKIWENREKINPEKSFISYLCTIAKNMLLNEYDHQMIQFVYREYVLNINTEAENTTEKYVDVSLLEEYVNKLINQLPPRRKTIFLLSRKEGLSNKKISEKLKISESTIETQLSKAVSLMKNALKEHYGSFFAFLITLFVK
jgi:RNA polymerase sigma-70 factor (ECF subfamily)